MTSPFPAPHDHDDPFGTGHDPFEDHRPRYRLLKLAFTLGAIALGLQSAEVALQLLAGFGGVRDLQRLMNDPRWGLFVGTPITWLAVVSAYLLIGRWRDPRWNRRVGLLVVMNTFDLLLWASEAGPALGVHLVAIQNDWVRHLVRVLQWFELLIFAALAAQVALHLGRRQAAHYAGSVRTFCIVGVVIWAILLVGATTWTVWPPVFRIASIEMLLLYLGSFAILGLAAYQTTILCILAARSCGEALADLHKADNDHDLLRSRSDNSADWPAHRDDPWK